jgi:hypothetical protein
VQGSGGGRFLLWPRYRPCPLPCRAPAFPTLPLPPPPAPLHGDYWSGGTPPAILAHTRTRVRILVTSRPSLVSSSRAKQMDDLMTWASLQALWTTVFRPLDKLFLFSKNGRFDIPLSMQKSAISASPGAPRSNSHSHHWPWHRPATAPHVLPCSAPQGPAVDPVGWATTGVDMAAACCQ